MTPRGIDPSRMIVTIPHRGSSKNTMVTITQVQERSFHSSSTKTQPQASAPSSSGDVKSSSDKPRSRSPSASSILLDLLPPEGSGDVADLSLPALSNDLTRKYQVTVEDVSEIETARSSDIDLADAIREQLTLADAPDDASSTCVSFGHGSATTFDSGIKDCDQDETWSTVAGMLSGLDTEGTPGSGTGNTRGNKRHGKPSQDGPVPDLDTIYAQIVDNPAPKKSDGRFLRLIRRIKAYSNLRVTSKEPKIQVVDEEASLGSLLSPPDGSTHFEVQLTICGLLRREAASHYELYNFFLQNGFFEHLQSPPSYETWSTEYNYAIRSYNPFFCEGVRVGRNDDMLFLREIFQDWCRQWHDWRLSRPFPC